jgi:photosynthetic reaction center cytochrome c subunit
MKIAHPRVVPCMLIAACGAAIVLSGCERPPVESLQGGFRGTGMETLINPRSDAILAANNQLPDVIPAAPSEGPLASTVYQNVRVLKDLNVAEFSRVMVAITGWVAPPDQSCNYCHASNMASDERYTKVVARRMLQMVRHINSDWRDHVANTGVTCYTCHRGNVVPANVWFTNPDQPSTGLTAGNAGQNTPSETVGLTSLPYDPFTRLLGEDMNIRVISKGALPGASRISIKQTEGTYSLMIHMSRSLGVNCTYCHNTRSFAVWDASTPKRTTAWYGIRMARDLNKSFMVPLTSTFPMHRLGVTGDVAKVNCATCHQGVFKPLYGASMAKDYPELRGEVHHEPPAGAPPATDAAATTPPTAMNAAR